MLATRRVLLGLGVLALAVPSVAAADPATVTGQARVGVYQGGCAYADDYPPVHDFLSVCVWDAIGDPDTLRTVDGGERTVQVQYFSSRCDPTCSQAEDRAQVPASGVTFDPAMTGMHVRTTVNGCAIELDASGLAQTPSTPAALLDPPYVRGPAHVGDETVATVADGGSSGLWQYYKTVTMSVCGRAAAPSGGYDTSAYGTVALLTEASLEAHVPDAADGVCADATVLWYWHPTNQTACLPPG